MVNFHNSVTIARELAATVNLWHTVDGIYIWEFFTTLHYEWDVIRGRSPYRWTIWVYSLTRIACLTAIILNMLDFDNTMKVNCQAQYTLNNFFSYIAFGSASMLIVFRIVAIWNRKTTIVLIAMGVWLTDVAFLIYGTTQLRAVWSDESSSCVMTNPDSNNITIIVSMACDVALLVILLVGLLRLRLEIGEFGLGRILWNQSLVWILLATVAEVPPVVFMSLNLNDPTVIMFEVPNIAITIIASTRMYRSLINLGASEGSSQAPWHTVSKLRFHSRSVPLKQVSVQEASLRTDSDQHPTSQPKVEAQTLQAVQTFTG
ncbi:hypothetical protein V8E52_004929 [Russula decolorans]